MCWSSYEKRWLLERLQDEEREPEREPLRVEAETEEQLVEPEPVVEREREVVLH